MSIKLYWNKVCPFVHRAWITAVEKKVPFELIEISLNEEAPAWYKAINPRETVPAVQLADGTIILESLYICRYFDEAYEPKNSLLTNHPETRLRINEFVETVSPLIWSMYSLLRSTPESEKSKNDAFLTEVTRIEKLVAESSDGPFFLGNQFSLADIAIVPFLDRFEYTLRAYRNVSIFERAPRLRKLLYAARQRPSVAQTSLPGRVYISSYDSYGGKVREPQLWTLYTKKGCPYCERVLLTISLIGEPLTSFITVKEIEDGNAEYSGSFPALKLPNGSTYPESMIIAEYLCDEFGSSLQPACPIQRSRGRLFVELSGGLVGQLNEFNASEFATSAAHAESLISGPFLLGDKPSLYDVAAMVSVDKAERHTEASKLVGPKLKALLAAGKALPHVGDVLRH